MKGLPRKTIHGPVLAAALTAFFFMGTIAVAQTVNLPGPAPNRFLPRDAARLNQQCTSCHRTIAAEWNRSLHRHAYDDPYFARAVKVEAVNFCRKCHAADANPDHDPAPALASNGVSCLTCHWTERGVVGAHGTGRSRVLDHNGIGDARWATDHACENCHQFDFPASNGASRRTPMQDTVREHELSPHASAPCQRCHMPLVTDPDGTSHHRHDFAVQADPSFLARAVTVELVSREQKRAIVAVSAGAVGHAFPTGDLFRSVELELWDASIAHSKRVVVRLARDYTQDVPSQSRRVVSDTRLKPTAHTRDSRLIPVELASENDTVAYRVTWIKMPKPLAKLFELEPSRDNRVVLEGKL